MEEGVRPPSEEKNGQKSGSTNVAQDDSKRKEDENGGGRGSSASRRGKREKGKEKGKEKEPNLAGAEDEQAAHDQEKRNRPDVPRLDLPSPSSSFDSLDPGPTPLTSPSDTSASASASASATETSSSSSSSTSSVSPQLTKLVLRQSGSGIQKPRRDMLLKWRTSLRTFLNEVEEDENNEDEHHTNEDISNRVRLYKRASADYEAQRAGQWSCRVCSFINEVQTNTCQVCGRRRRRTTSHNDMALHFDDDEEEDEDLPRRNTLTSGCPVAKIANEILLHIFSYLDVRDLVSAASVCRKWRHITDDNYLWGDLILYHASRLLGRWEARRMLEEDEDEDRSENVLYYHLDGGRFKAASLDRLLDIITSGDDVDLNEQRAFLVTYPSFTSSEVLLTKLIGLYNRVTRKAERPDGDRGRSKTGDEDGADASRRPVTLCLGTMSLKDSTKSLDEEEQPITDSDEDEAMTPRRRRFQTVNTPREKSSDAIVWKAGKTDGDGKAVLYASGGNLPSRGASKSSGSLTVGEARRPGLPSSSSTIPPPPPPPPPMIIEAITPKQNRIKNIIVKPAKQLVSPLTSSSAHIVPSSSTLPSTNQPEHPAIAGTETFAKQVRICSVLKKWVESHYDELPRGVIDLLLAFVRGRLLRQRHPAYAQLGFSLVMSITRRARLMRAGESSHANIFPQLPPEPDVPRNICSPALSLWDVPPREIARQLTLIEFERFKAIKISELFGQAWSSSRLRHKAKNVVAMINAFNEFCMWVATTVLSYERIKDRVKCIEIFAAIAKHLFKLKNFNTLMALLAGLRSGPVYRLAYTRAEVSKKADKIIEQLNMLMRGDSAYKTYRDALSHSTPPCIPYLGVHLSDLTFIEDGNPDDIKGLINFTKRRFLFRVISEISRYQQNAYNLHPVPQIQGMLTKLRPMSDDELYELSLQREPRDVERKDIL